MAKSKQTKKNTKRQREEREVFTIINEINAKSLDAFQKFMARTPTRSIRAMEHMSHMGRLYQKLMSKMMHNPNKLATMQMHYWQDYMKFWRNTALQWLDLPYDPVITASEEDRRFRSEQWQKHPYFSFIKRFYLLTAKHIQSVVNEVEGLDDKTAHQIEFYTRQFIDALSPTNFLGTNPDVLQKTIETRGKNLIKGLNNMLEDLERSEGQLRIKKTDLDAFKVGKNIATTPGDIIYQNDLMQLIQYKPTTKKVYQRPLLIIPPWINKYYILDLSQQNSMVKWLVDQGYTVFLISWVNPTKKHAYKDFSDYMLEGPISALDAIEQATGVKAVNAMGFCIGGTLLACTLAYNAVKKDHRIKSATYLATLLDFSEPGDMSAFIDEKQIQILEKRMNQKGYLDGGQMSMMFNMLRANDLIWSYFIKNYLQGEEPFPFDMLFWNADATNMPAKMHSTYLRSMYLKNCLVRKCKFELKGVDINLTKIKVPVYFLSTHHDHIAPWKTTYNGTQLHQGPVTFILGGSGHIAGVINPPENNKYCYYTNSELPKDPDQWLAYAKEHPGSWWPHWNNWLIKHSGKLIPARNLKSGNLKVIEPAPGSYVKARLKDINNKE